MKYLGFDVASSLNLIAVLEAADNGNLTISVRDLRDLQLVSNVDASFLPHYFRFSPDGNQIVFGSNHGRIYVLDVFSGDVELLFADPQLQAGFPTWTPDGSRIVFSAYGASKEAPRPPHILSLEVLTRRVTGITNGSQAGDRFPQLSPDGRFVAFFRQFVDEPRMPGRICMADLVTKETSLVAGVGSTSCSIRKDCWSPDSSHLLVKSSEQGRNRLEVVSLASAHTVWSTPVGEACVGAYSPCSQRVLMVDEEAVRWISVPSGETGDRLPLNEIGKTRWTLSGGEIAFDSNGRHAYLLSEDSTIWRWGEGLSRVTAPARPAEVKVELVHTEYLSTARDGRAIPVHRFTPANPRAPVVEVAIGGPGSMVRFEDCVIASLVNAGFEVIAPVYRGCDGYGEEHREANTGQFGGADMLDVVDCGLQWVRGEGRDRPLALVGYSYGGYLSLLALAQPDAPWNAGVALWSATEPFGVHLQRWFPADPAERAKAVISRSPMEQCGRIGLPLLIIHGALDTFPVENLKVVYDGVASRGVPAEMVVFDDDTHGLHLHFEEAMRRLCRFVETPLRNCSPSRRCGARPTGPR